MTAHHEHHPQEIDRRRALRTGAAVVAGAGALWAAPVILSVDAASAATAPPAPLMGIISGTVSFCFAGNPPPQGGVWNVVATPVSPGPSVPTTTDQSGVYSLVAPAGTYDVTFTPAGGPFNGPAETVNNVVVVGSATTTLDHVYQSTC